MAAMSKSIDAMVLRDGFVESDTRVTADMSIGALFEAASRTCGGTRYKPAGLIVSLRACGSRPRRGREKFCWWQCELDMEEEKKKEEGEMAAESEQGTEDDIVEPTAKGKRKRKGRKGRKGQPKAKAKAKRKKAVGSTMSSSVLRE